MSNFNVQIEVFYLQPGKNSMAAFKAVARVWIRVAISTPVILSVSFIPKQKWSKNEHNFQKGITWQDHPTFIGLTTPIAAFHFAVCKILSNNQLSFSDYPEENVAG